LRRVKAWVLAKKHPACNGALVEKNDGMSFQASFIISFNGVLLVKGLQNRFVLALSGYKLSDMFEAKQYPPYGISFFLLIVKYYFAANSFSIDE
jgi:hypothetical protein